MLKYPETLEGVCAAIEAWASAPIKANIKPLAVLGVKGIVLDADGVWRVLEPENIPPAHYPAIIGLCAYVVMEGFINTIALMTKNEDSEDAIMTVNSLIKVARTIMGVKIDDNI